MVALAKPCLDDDALAVVVDPAEPAEPADVDRLLDALDHLVERRISRRKTRKKNEN